MLLSLQYSFKIKKGTWLARQFKIIYQLVPLSTLVSCHWTVPLTVIYNLKDRNVQYIQDIPIHPASCTILRRLLSFSDQQCDLFKDFCLWGSWSQNLHHIPGDFCPGSSWSQNFHNTVPTVYLEVSVFEVVDLKIFIMYKEISVYEIIYLKVFIKYLEISVHKVPSCL